MGRGRSWWLAILLILTGVPITACSGALPQPPAAQAAVAQADVPRNNAPAVPEADVAALSAGNTAFALDLYRELRGQKGNLFYSPYSISAALAMTYAGARGQTEEEMARTLHYTLPQERLHPAFNYVDLQLMSLGKGAQGKDGKGFRLKVANSLWGQTGYQFLPKFLETLAANYGAGLRLLDFQRAPEPARATINDWVGQQTEGKIPDLLAQGTIKPDTRLVLANAVYFNAAWKNAFDKAATRPLPFTLLDGRRIDVPMMSQQASFRYAKGEDYQAVELPYDGGELAMVLLVPDQGKFQQFEGSLSVSSLENSLKALQPRQVSLTMPSFAYDSSFQLRDALSALGMGGAMTDGADFSGMSEGRDLSIDDVIHKAIVKVNEDGTEAAAATAVVVRTTSAPAGPQDVVTLKVDRPFVFLIRDLKTGTILFVGRVLEPSEKAG